MTKSARSLLMFAIYLGTVGIGTIAIPGVLLSWFGVPPPTDNYIRLVGVGLLFLASYYAIAAWKEMKLFIRYSAYVRSLIPFYFGLFVIFGWLKPILFFISLIDFAFALWTLLVLKQEKLQTEHSE